MFSIHSTECILQQDTKKHAHALTEELPRCREHLVPVFTNILHTQIQSTHLHLLHYWPTTDQSTHTSPPCTSHIDSCVLKVPPPLVTPTLTSVMTPPPPNDNYMLPWPQSLKSSDHPLLHHHRPADLDFLLLWTVFLFGSQNDHCSLFFMSNLPQMLEQISGFYYFHQAATRF